MKNRTLPTIALTLTTLIGTANAATITVNTADSTDFSAGKTNLITALLAVGDGDTIAFNIPGAGPHYLQAPADGFPLLIKDRVTIDGYTQPGSSRNSNPITASNNAVIKIVLDARNGNYRDMRYDEYGSTVVSSPPIDNTAMVNERAGYTGTERATLGIYRATNAVVRGLAFLGNGSDAYAIAVAHDYGLDTSVKDRLAYDAGSSRNCHINGCWFGIDPTNPTPAGLAIDGVAVAFFRHRDVSGGPRPELPNESLIFGVKAGSSNPRAEFNVSPYLGYVLAGEAIRSRISGNFIGVMPDGVTPSDAPAFFDDGIEIGRYDDTEPMIVGTDGDGVNDADEGNLFGPLTAGEVLGFYSYGNKFYIVSGNRFGIAVNGTRWTNSQPVLADSNIGSAAKVQFGSDFNGVSDALEANVVYNNNPFSTLFPNPTTTVPPRTIASDAGARVSVRGNILINNGLMPFSYADGLGGRLAAFTNYCAPFMSTNGSLIPVLSASSRTDRIIGTCASTNGGVYSNIFVDVYVLDPEGWTNGMAFMLSELSTNGFPQGKTYRGTFVDNGPLDSNPAVGAFNFNSASLNLGFGTQITVTANYSQDPAGTSRGRTHTSNFSDPVALAAPPGVIFVTTTNNSSANGLAAALTNVQAGGRIWFNIPGAGPHYLQTPAGGYPLITASGVTIDGYSQPGSSPNTNPILSNNNAQIKIVLTSTNGNYTDMAYEPSNPNAGFGPGEVAVLGILNASNVTVRGLCLLGDRLEGHYAIAVARNYSGGAVGLGNGLHVNGCWIGVDVDGSPGRSFAEGVVAYRHRDDTIGNAARLPSNRHVVGVKAGSSNPRSEFNVIVGGTINIIMEGQAHRVAGNFLGVLPSGTNDYIVPFAELGRFAESHIEIGRGASDVVIGTDGDGVNDADERNVMSGVVTDGNTASGSFNLGGYRHVVELYSLSSSPGEDRQRVRVSGNYIGVGVDGVTRFTNGVSILNGSSVSGTHYWIGSDFDGVSDAIEGNVFYGNYPPGLFYATAYTNSTSSGSGSHGFFDEPDPLAGGFSTRGNSIVNNYPYPFNPRRANSFANITNYVNKALAVPTTNFYALFPVISPSSTTARLIGTVPAGNTNYPWTIIDVYLPDPEGLTNGLVVPDPFLTNGWVHGKKYLGSFADNSSADLDPAPGAFAFNTCSLGLTNGSQITISANYSKDAPGTHNARVLTSLFSVPVTVPAGVAITSVSQSGSTLTITWCGGAPPYTLQKRVLITNPWSDAQTGIAGNSTTDALSGGSAFYRVVGKSN